MLFCALTTSAGLDPEEYLEILRTCQDAAGEVVDRFGGHTAQRLGDGLLAYFGYPVAHEEDTQRAVHAGLGIIEAIERLTPRLEAVQGIRLGVRVGIHTGSAVAGEVGSGEVRERLAIGQTPNIAARLCALAEPGTVVVSDQTQTLVQGFFACRSLGPRVLKGVSAPLEVHQVLGQSGVRTSFELALARGLSPAVGRQDELATLLRSLEKVQEGHGRTVLITGDAGIGKSRLVQLFRERAAGEVHRWLVCRCSLFQQNSAFSAVLDLLQDLLRLRPEDTAADRLRKLQEGLVALGFPGAEERELFARLLGLEPGEDRETLGLTPQRRKEKTLSALLGILAALAERGPVVLAIEDLHWVDPSTLEFLKLLVRQGPSLRLLLLLTSRPSFSPAWGGHPAIVHILLDHLGESEVEALARGVAGGRTLPPEVLLQIVAKTDGVPLFVEELTKMLLGSGLLREEGQRYVLTAPLPPLAIPATLEDSLLARLDRLSGTREVVQIAAVLGRELTWGMIRAVCPLPEETLRRELERLVDADLLYQRGVPPAASYTFKHALLQEAAYGSLLRSTRQQLHQRIAAALTEQFPAEAAARPEVVAHHFTEAGLHEQALPCWLEAGRHAAERSAHVEAIGHFEKGLGLLDALPEGRERDSQELALRTALGPALIATRGYTTQGVEQCYARALELCNRLGETPEHFWVLRGLWVFHLIRAELPKALELGRSMMRLADASGDRTLLFEAHLAAALPQLFRGEPALARELLERGISLDSPERDRSTMSVTGIDIAATSIGTLGLVLWQLGLPDQALARSEQAIVLAREIAHPYSLADALSMATWLRYFRREASAVREQAASLVTLAEEKGFLHEAAHGNMRLGWAMVHGPDPSLHAEGLRRVLGGIEAFGASRARLSELNTLSLLIECYIRLGRIEEGRRTAARARELLSGLEDRFFWQPEIHRLEGELALLEPGGHARLEEAAERFRQALDLARRLGSKALELRAAASLARLWRSQGRDEEARNLLAPLYASFSEGFATPDLQDAAALLGSLGIEAAGPAVVR